MISIHIKDSNPLYKIDRVYDSILSKKSLRQSIMLQVCKLSNNTSESIDIKEIHFELFSSDNLVHKSIVNYDELILENKDKCNVNNDDFLKLHSGQSVSLINTYFDVYSKRSIDKLIVRIDNYIQPLGIFKISAYNPKTSLILPVKGNVCVLGDPFEIWGHRTLVSSEFAVDIIKIGSNFKPFNDDFLNLSNHFIYGEEVIAPADGEIIDYGDGLPDNPIPYDQTSKLNHISKYKTLHSEEHLAGGNYIIIRHSDNEYSYLGHLKCNSIKVTKGLYICKGETIAQCGNSGLGSIAPHLHFHLMDKASLKKSRTLPFNFSDIYSGIFTREIMEYMKMPSEMSEFLYRTNVNNLYSETKDLQ